MGLGPAGTDAADPGCLGSVDRALQLGKPRFDEAGCNVWDGLGNSLRDCGGDQVPKGRRAVERLSQDGFDDFRKDIEYGPLQCGCNHLRIDRDQRKLAVVPWKDGGHTLRTGEGSLQ